MVFAVIEINNNPALLPGVTLGYQIHDSCASVPVALQAAFQLINGHDPEHRPDQHCSQAGTVIAFVGESGSTPSISVSRLFKKYCNIFQVSHYATCACLSDKQQYPNFFRTISSDHFQAAALVRLVKHFGWTWIGTINSDSDYGNNGMASFLSAAMLKEVLRFISTTLNITILMLYNCRSTATVIVAFVASGDMRILLDELCQEPVPQRQWVGSESWVTDPELLRYSPCVGRALGLGIPQSVIPGLKDFLSDLPLSTVSASPVLREFWEETFNCRMPTNAGPDDTVCDGSEDIETFQSPYTDTSQLRITNMVYKAVYAIAHAIHNALCLGHNSNQCNNLTPLQATQVLDHLKKVNFTQNGYSVSFDANGDPVASYELVNWQVIGQGAIQLETVGHFDASQLKGQEFRIQKVPLSVCSQSCVPGTRKVLQKGKPICCYDCIACPDGEISNITDSTNCHSCPEEFWSNPKRDSCLPKSVEFLSFSEDLGIILVVFSVGGACLAILTAAVFFRNRNTPIVKANNSELSFWLLFSLALCFLCSLTFIGAPSEWSCMLRHTAFGITFVLCIACVLGKTIVVLMAFRATLPGSNVMKWFGPPQQRMTVISFTLIQVLICIIWLVVNPPFPIKNKTTYKDRIILECALGSPIGFWAVLGYIGLLAILCFILAFLARKLPNNFNEAKFITFSMLIFCAVWITFIPAYVSSPGKFTVAVEIFAILSSSFGLIFCIFLPKCYIILFNPEKNTKKHLMTK
uniref:G-protein coupled receptors family 3 profile domain-containing protein n=1 Tax=Neogobius melanostomus TaxID=47308 RepID=A0A8C6WG99_9GOBI